MGRNPTMEDIKVCRAEEMRLLLSDSVKLVQESKKVVSRSLKLLLVFSVS